MELPFNARCHNFLGAFTVQHVILPRFDQSKALFERFASISPQRKQLPRVPVTQITVMWTQLTAPLIDHRFVSRRES